MENIEFTSASDGSITARTCDGSKIVTENDREIVSFMYEEIRDIFPDTFNRLCNLYAKYKRNEWHFQFLVVKRFVRCNMGLDDMLTFDVEKGILNVEFVNCPLRGECPDEHIICCPKSQSKLTVRQKEIARLYAQGKRVTDISVIIGRSKKTVSNTLSAIKKVLGLRHTSDIITYYLKYKI